MSDALPIPSAVANLTSNDGTVVLTQYGNGRVVDLSVPGAGGTSVHGVTLGADVPVVAGTPTDVTGLTVPTADGDVWEVTVTAAFLPGATTTAWSFDVQAVSAHSTLTGGAASAGGNIIAGATDVNLDALSVSFTGLWTTAGGADTLKVVAHCVTANGTVKQLVATLAGTGLVARKVV